MSENLKKIMSGTVIIGLGGKILDLRYFDDDDDCVKYFNYGMITSCFYLELFT
jgi:hypothetical protein